MYRVSDFAVAVGLGGLLLAAGACHAREPASMSQTHQPGGTATVDDVVGLWTIRLDGQSGFCTLALNRLPVQDGFGVQIETCTLPTFATAARWRQTDEGFELVNEGGGRLQAFRQTGVDGFAAADGTARLERAPLA